MEKAPVAIVTGGAQGLGAEITKALIKEGYQVCVADIQEDKGEQFVYELERINGKGKTLFLRCDVTKESDYKNVFEGTIKHFGRVDVLVNNAGIIDETNPRKVLDINVIGPIIGCRTALEYMGKRKGGKGGIVINTASIAGFLPHHSVPVYIASKHAVIGLTRSYGHPYHLEREGVIFAAICPSFIKTELLGQFQTHSLVEGLDVSQRPDVMSADFAAQGVIKLLEDRINGSTLLVTKEHGYVYIGIQEELQSVDIQ